MKTAREVAHGLVGFRCSMDGIYHAEDGRCHLMSCDELTAVIEARDRETVEACAKAVESERLLEPNEDDDGDEAYQHAVNHCARAVRSLAPGGTK